MLLDWTAAPPSKDFICDLATVDPTIFFPLFANFTKIGLLIYCSWENGGFSCRIFFWVLLPSSKRTRYSTPLCWTSGSQCPLLMWQIISTCSFSYGYFAANFTKEFNIIALLLLLPVWKCLFTTSNNFWWSFSLLTILYENSPIK